MDADLVLHAEPASTLLIIAAVSSKRVLMMICETISILL